MSENLSDKEALYLLLNDPERAEMALTIIWDRYYIPLCSFAYRLTGDKDDARDIVSEVFVNLWSVRDKNRRNILDLKAYMASSVYNCVRNWARSRKRRTNRDKKWTEERGEDISYAADTALIQAEFFHTLYKALEKLQPQTREIFLAYMKGLDPQTISKQFGLKPQSVRNQKARAIQHLISIFNGNHILILILALGEII